MAHPDHGPKTSAPAVDLRGWLAREIAALNPASFALVMATGIISNAFFLQGRHVVSDALFAVNLAAFPWLIALTLLRAVRYPGALWTDLLDPRQVFSFFTVVAGADVVGVGVYLRGFPNVAATMWVAALILWFALIYFSFGVLTFLNTARGAGIIDGGWLIAIIGAESLVILGSVVAPHLGALGPTVFVLIHMLWGVGLGLYGIFIVLFAQRMFFVDVAPQEIMPLHWVVMGAAAIATNAGSTLIHAESGIPFLSSMRPFIDGVTLILWAWATWWIPMLVVFGVWKHVVWRVPLTYTPMLWSVVFPLGMYALASLRLSLATGFSPLRALSRGMVWIALAAWAATAVGLALASWKSLRSSASPACDGVE